MAELVGVVVEPALKMLPLAAQDVPLATVCVSAAVLDIGVPIISPQRRHRLLELR